MQRFSFLIVSFGLLLLPFSAYSASAETPSNLEGKELYGLNAFANPFTVQMNADGKMVGAAGYKQEFTDEGRWWVRDDGQICRQWNNWVGGELRCQLATFQCGLVVWKNELGETVDENYIRPIGSTRQKCTP